ncbi:MarC family protein [Propionivibrio sp.]|uniref:MarC family protein n=1 Tax=Propionivibrio sp. TaxID=2212460 RepID=UPI00272DF8A9|nr:MarC family protein [Propionivibrio sp.]
MTTMNGELFSSVFLLLLVLDPLGNMPFVLSLLRNTPEARRPRIILRECAIATLVLVGFLFVGDWLLYAMRLSDPALEIAGGVILLLIALRMAFPPPKHTAAEHETATEPLIVPLAIPMIAGPSALATVLLASRHSNGETLLWVGAVVLACLINAALLLASGWFSRLFGKAGMEALERLMGLILTAIAVQMLITGIRIAFKIG